MSSVLKKASVVVLLLVFSMAGLLKAEANKVEQQGTAVRAADANSAAEQKTCPVMGNPINKKIYTVYQGKKVYFCCKMCKPEFEKNPEKYIDKLPQFSKQK